MSRLKRKFPIFLSISFDRLLGRDTFCPVSISSIPHNYMRVNNCIRVEEGRCYIVTVLEHKAMSAVDIDPK